jgi:hypothetical protein
MGRLEMIRYKAKGQKEKQFWGLQWSVIVPITDRWRQGRDGALPILRGHQILVRIGPRVGGPGESALALVHLALDRLGQRDGWRPG